MKMSRDEVEAFLEREFPQIHDGGRVYALVAVSAAGVTLTLDAATRHLRPGGTVSGPSMMALADIAAYAAILSALGPHALAVTTSFNINFLRRPAPGKIAASARLLKAGRRLAVVEIALEDGEDELVAHATATYAIPPG